MPRVFQLGYVALEAREFEKTRDYYLNTLGTKLVATDEDGTLYLSIGYNHHDIVIKPAKEKNLMHNGFQLNPGTDLKEFCKELANYGLKAQVKSDSQPGIAELVEVEVVKGNSFQFYETMEAPAPGFNTNGVAPLRLGHVAVITPEAQKLIKFYSEFLGFHKTDILGGRANFLTCNRDHHVVNIVDAPPTKVHHVAFELRESAAHTFAADKLIDKGVVTEWGPSRHTAGHNIAAYHHDPSGVMIELYTDMDVYIPELGFCEPRPWHEHLPMKPNEWELSELTTWQTVFAANLGDG